MFNLFKKKPVIELAQYEAGTVYFTCRESLLPGSKVKVMARLPEGEQFPVTVEIGDERYAARAVVITGSERDELFERQMKAAEQFRTYQTHTERVIPVVELVRA